MIVTGHEFAVQAQSQKYTGITYSQLDCQGFVEQVLKDTGVRKADGTPFNWKGSNSMWRNALSWKGTITECVEQFGSVPDGAWVFIVKHDGGEVERGYHDNEGNATHVGIYCEGRSDPVRDSTKTSKRDGVGYRTLASFTHVGLPKMIDYANITDSEDNALIALRTLRDNKTNDTEMLKALVVLTNYLKGV